MSQVPISFGDNVRVRDTPATRARSLTGLSGEVHGHTTPSMTHVEVIGELLSDYAIAVHFKHLAESLWLTPELLEFIDHGAGLEITIGTQKLIRQVDGSWVEESTGRVFPSAEEAHMDFRGRSKLSRPWWKFW